MIVKVSKDYKKIILLPSKKKNEDTAWLWILDNNLFNDFSKYAFLSLSEIAELLKFKTNDSAISWLNQNKITIHRFGKKSKGVYELDFYSSLMLPFSEDFLKKHPNKGEVLLKEIISNDSIFNMILLKLDDNSIIKRKPKTKVVPKSDKEIELINKLLG